VSQRVVETKHPQSSLSVPVQVWFMSTMMVDGAVFPRRDHSMFSAPPTCECIPTVLGSQGISSCYRGRKARTRDCLFRKSEQVFCKSHTARSSDPPLGAAHDGYFGPHVRVPLQFDIYEGNGAEFGGAGDGIFVGKSYDLRRPTRVFRMEKGDLDPGRGAWGRGCRHAQHAWQRTEGAQCVPVLWLGSLRHVFSRFVFTRDPERTH
jgi:hypothetical protein